MDSLRDIDGLIDVRKLIARHSVEQHQAQADAYFAGYSEDSVLLRKPFQAVGEAAQITQGLSIMLRQLRLFHGARVMDFGAGTAWLSRILAYLHCEAIAVDLSKSALELGRRVIEKDHFANQLKISYLPYDGVRIPLPDAHVERVCCFDAFHHVADQKATLREFFRVLKPGGIAGFHEPGPHHSRGADSQREMAHFSVIENDIVIEEIAAIARDIGFGDVKVAWYMPGPILMDVGRFNKLLGPDMSHADERAIVSRSRDDLQDVRIFFLYKPGEEVADSRSHSGLNARLAVNGLRRQGHDFVGSVVVENTGTHVWLPSADGGVGAVRLGVQVTDEAGRMIALDYARFDVSDVCVRPGECTTVSFRIEAPALAQYRLVFDLVSEFVAWFAQVGSQAVTISSRDLPK